MRRKQGLACVQGAWLLALGVLTLAPSNGQSDGRNGAHVRVQFVDTTGSPVAGVECVHSYAPGASTKSVADGEGRIDADFTWSAEFKTTWYNLEARRFGFARYSFRSSDDVRSGQLLDIGKVVLEPGGAVAGCARDGSGAPFAEAEVIVVAAAEPAAAVAESDEKGPDWKHVIDGTTADDHGAFDLVGLRPGKYVLWSKHRSTYWRSSPPLEVKPAQRAQVGDVVLHSLPREWSIEGIVTDSLDRPIAGATVSGSIPEDRTDSNVDAGSDSFNDVILELKATTNAVGHFVLYLPRRYNEPIELEASVPSREYEGAIVSGIKRGARDVCIHLGAMREVEILVQDAAGKPVETYGWRVSSAAGARIEQPRNESPMRRAGGRARLSVPARPVFIHIESNAYRNNGDALVLTATPSEAVVIRLVALDALTGKVLCAGRAIADARVELVRLSYVPLDTEIMPRQWNGLFSRAVNYTAISDANGMFSVPYEMTGSTFIAHAWAPGFAEGFSASASVGGPPVVVELTPGCTLEGRVLLPNEHSPRGIEVKVYRKEVQLKVFESELGLVFRTNVEGDGHWKVDSLAPGPWLVKLSLPGRVVSELGLDANFVERCAEVPWQFDASSAAVTQADIDLRKEELCTLEGLISIGDRPVMGRAKLILEPPMALQVASGGLASGRFSLAVRRPGRYRIILDVMEGHPNYIVITDLIDLVPGKNEWKRELPAKLWKESGIRLDAR